MRCWRQRVGSPAVRVVPANAAWTLLWAVAHNLTRNVGVLASGFHDRATTARICAHLINVPAPSVRSARQLTLHLPQRWPWEPAWAALHTARQPCGGQS
jgi:hypothetical protein